MFSKFDFEFLFFFLLRHHCPPFLLLMSSPLVFPFLSFLILLFSFFFFYPYLVFSYSFYLFNIHHIYRFFLSFLLYVFHLLSSAISIAMSFDISPYALDFHGKLHRNSTGRFETPLAVTWILGFFNLEPPFEVGDNLRCFCTRHHSRLASSEHAPREPQQTKMVATLMLICYPESFSVALRVFMLEKRCCVSQFEH